MDPTQTAWAAGLFEGEGCIWQGPYSAYLKLTMTDYDVMKKFADWAGYGKINVDNWNNVNRPNCKVAFQWRIGKRKEVIRILSAMLPHFGNRRAYKALNILDNLELTPS